MTAGRTKTDMYWIKAEIASINQLDTYLVRWGESVKCRRPYEIMNGGTIISALKLKVDIAWVAKIKSPVA